MIGTTTPVLASGKALIIPIAGDVPRVDAVSSLGSYVPFVRKPRHSLLIHAPSKSGTCVYEVDDINRR